MKRWGFAAATVVLVATVAELVTYLVFGFYRDSFTFFKIDSYLLTDTTIKYANQGYDPRLGWDTRYDTEFGERPHPKSRGRAALATFGDSYTHCDEVEDGETWQELLADRLGRDVYNFGTGGYGTDQALLKFREKFPQVKTKVAVLGLVAENINRIVNVYRPFYSIATGQRVTKPRFRLDDGALELLPNPVSHERDLAKLRDPAFIESIGDHDYWYNRNDYPVFLFPYSRILFNRWMWSELVYNNLGYKVDDLNPRPWENLWFDPESSQLMFAIFDAFVREAREAGAVPVILLIPKLDELTNMLRRGFVPAGHAEIAEFCLSRGYDCFNPTEDFVAYVREGNTIESLYLYHVNAKGNGIIAGGLEAFLRDTVCPKADCGLTW